MRAFDCHVEDYMTMDTSRTYHCISDHDTVQCCKWLWSVFSGFRYDVDENCAFLGYYVASSVNFLPAFRDNLSVPKHL